MNSPCPNLKKLMLPESTAATMTIFFPVFRATNGFGLRTGTEDGNVDGDNGKNHGNIRRMKDLSDPDISPIFVDGICA